MTQAALSMLLHEPDFGCALHRYRKEAKAMTATYWIAALIALALSVYLTVALLKPEWFE